MIYSVIPSDLIWNGFAETEPPLCHWERRGDAVVEVIRGRDCWQVQRLYSTDLQDYLNPLYCPTAPRFPRREVF